MPNWKSQAYFLTVNTNPLLPCVVLKYLPVPGPVEVQRQQRHNDDRIE